MKWSIMYSSTFLALALSSVKLASSATTSYASRLPLSTIEPSLTQIVAAEATQTVLSPVSNVKGVAFDRIVQIWLENTVRPPIYCNIPSQS